MQLPRRSRSRSSRAICASRRGRRRSGEPFPVLGVRGSVLGQRLECHSDLVEAQAYLLGDPDERHPSQGVPGVATLPALRAGGMNQALGLIEAKSRGSDTGSLAQGTDGQLRLGLHAENLLSTEMNLKEA